MRTIDRYLVREILPPFLLALGLFTFILAINPILDYAKGLLAKGVPVGTVGVLLLALVPQALSLTIPMAFLTGLLMALGRISSDRESVALLACGISPVRLLRPILILAVAVGLADMYVLMKLKPDANQTFRNIAFRHLTEHTAADIKPQVFFEQFPGRVLFVGDSTREGGWSRVMIADTTDPANPAVTFADSGRLHIDRAERQVQLVLGASTQYSPGRSDARVYTTAHHPGDVVIKVTAESVFGSGDLVYPRGFAEKSWAELRRDAEGKRAQGLSPHNEILHMQQMLSFPVACLVFAVLALPLGLNTRREGRLAALAVGLAIIAAYYMLMEVAAGWVKGEAWTGGMSVPAVWARWVPNVVLGLVGLGALWYSARGTASRPLLPTTWLWRRVEAATDSGATRVRDGSGPRRPVLVIRLPSLRLPVPRLLDRYVSRRYLGMVFLAFAALLTISYISETVDLAEKVFKGQANSRMLLAYLWHRTPQLIAFVIPVATLVAALGTIGALTRSGELMVMRASGVSLYRTALPLIVLAAVWGTVLFVLEDRVLGYTNRAATSLRDTIRGRVPHTVDAANPNWMVGRDGRIYHFAVFETPNRANASRPTLHALSVFETTDGPYRLARHTYADRATFEGGAWRAQRGWTQVFTGDTSTRQDFDQLTLQLEETENFQHAQIEPSRMSYRELQEYVRRLGHSGYNVAEHRVDLHRRLAFPAVTLVMTLLAVPFGVTTGKKGALYGIGLAAMLAVAYFLLLTFFVAVGAAGVLPAWLAAWTPNLLFAAGALFLMFTVRT